MTREIKFRAWNIDRSGKMMSWEDMEDPEDGIYNFDMLNSLLGGEFAMQYTGLKDKNGVEIYEGDILGGYPHGTVSVEWSKRFACFQSNPLDGGDHCLFGNDFDDCKDKWEVIGNIYQNPNLLKND